MAINAISSSIPSFVLRQLDLQTTAIARATQRITTGLRINRAGDDPAGISMAAKFLAQLGGITTAQTNVQLGISLEQTAEGGLNAIKDGTDRAAVLAIQAQGGGLTINNLTPISAELEQLQGSITDVVSTTTFNTKQLLAGGTVTIQSGPQAGQSIAVTLPDLVNPGATKTAIDDLNTAIDAFQASVAASNLAQAQLDAATLQTKAGDATTAILGEVSRMGGVNNRLSANLGVLSAMNLGTSSALSSIRDADTAAEAVQLARQQVLQASSIAMLTQFNTQAALVLKLLQ